VNEWIEELCDMTAAGERVVLSLDVEGVGPGVLATPADELE